MSIANTQAPFIPTNMASLCLTNTALNTTVPHANHPSFPHLAGLVSEAVLEVVFVALPGFLAAYNGAFPASAQKFVAELNTMVFTPCLIFSKLAGKLTRERLPELWIIPVLFMVMTGVSYVCSRVMVWWFGFEKKGKIRQKNFVLAMGVFGNSNSLPISLVFSLSRTISGLHWDKKPGDNDEEVATRGILYLLIFQQLGQFLRWTWGYNVLLKPVGDYKPEELETEEGALEGRQVEEGERYSDEPDLLDTSVGKAGDSAFDSGSGSRTPTTRSIGSSSSENAHGIGATPTNMNIPAPTSPTSPRPNGSGTLDSRSRSTNHITVFPNFGSSPSHPSSTHLNNHDGNSPPSWTTPIQRTRHLVRMTSHTVSVRADETYASSPPWLQRVFTFLGKVYSGVAANMNPPLWAMLAAIVVACLPRLQQFFFAPGTFVANSVTAGITQTGAVAVPLILVVLGANLARSTLPVDQLASSPAEKAEERKLLLAALCSRMLLPPLVLAIPFALLAKYAPVSIVDDPIFVVVIFLLTGAPSALQLAQICQINGVFMGAMSSLLVASYVGCIFPSTLGLVLVALEVLEWAAQ